MVQSVYFFPKEEQRWTCSQMDKLPAEPGSVWKRFVSTSVRACWKNRRAAPLAIGSTTSRWLNVSILSNVPNNLASRSKRLPNCSCCAWTDRPPVKKSNGTQRRKSPRWSRNYSSYSACGKHCSTWPPFAQERGPEVAVPCSMRSTSTSRLMRLQEETKHDDVHARVL